MISNYSLSTKITGPVPRFTSAGQASPLQRATAPRFGTTTVDGNTPPEMTDAAILTAMDTAHDALKHAEGRPGLVRLALEKLTHGSEGTIDKLIKALQGVKKEIQENRSCEIVRSPSGAEIGQRIKVGSLEHMFHNRRNFYPSDQFDFKSFLKNDNVFGSKRRVIIALTGWTRPPAQYLLQNELLKEEMSQHPPEKWTAFAEQMYVQGIRNYLGTVIKRLNEAGYSKDDVAFLYGVTPKGVDRAVEEFCDDQNILYAGVTCYDWVHYLEDVGGKRPIYLAKDQAEFGRFLSEASDKLVVVGGSALASTITQNGERVGKHHAIIPVDLMQMRYNVRIPAVVVSDVDRSSSKVENAAAVLNGNKETNPANWPEVHDGLHSYEHDDPFEVKSLVILLKQALQNMIDARTAGDKLKDTP